MEYLGTPLRRAQRAMALADGAAALAAAWLGVANYPVPTLPVVAPAWAGLLVLATYLAGGYDLPRLGPLVSVIRLGAAAGAAALLCYPLLAGSDRLRLQLLLELILLSIAAMLALRWLGDRLRPRTRRSASFLVTSDAARHRIEEARAAAARHWEIGAVVKVSDGASAVVAEVLATQPDLVVCELGHGLERTAAERLLAAQVAGTEVRDLVDFYGAVTGRLPLDLVDHAWLLHQGLSAEGADAWARLRRLFEIAVAAPLLLLAAPLLALIALAVRLDSPGAVLFRQERLGRFKRPFTLYKFRTMAMDAERDGPRWASPGDPRVTRLGRWLRRTRLDELPQLVNLLRGEVGLIGPRPIRQVFAEQLARAHAFYDLRFLYRPGLTGWSQVLGPYGATAEEHATKLEMDLYYLHHRTLVGDLYILLATARVMLGARGT